MYRYFISGYSREREKGYVDWGIVAAACYKEACDKIFDFYGEHLEGEIVYEFRIYELQDVLSTDELQDMMTDELSKNPF